MALQVIASANPCAIHLLAFSIVLFSKSVSEQAHIFCFQTTLKSVFLSRIGCISSMVQGQGPPSENEDTVSLSEEENEKEVTGNESIADKFADGKKKTPILEGLLSHKA